MATRRPLVVVSGNLSELPTGDTVVGVTAGSLTAGSGLDGGGTLDGSARRFDIELAAAPSGLIFVGTGDNSVLGMDGVAEATATAALASGNAALTDLIPLPNKVSKGGDVVSGTLVIESQSYGTVAAFTGSGVINLDFGTSNNHVITLEGNSTLAAPISASGGQAGAVVIHQDAAGSRTLAYSGGWAFAGGTPPILTTTASGTDILVYYCSDSSTFNASSILDVQGA